MTEKRCAVTLYPDEACGVRVANESLITYREGGLELSRTALNGYEVRSAGRLVFRSQHTGD